MKPLITVLLPVYNGEQYLADAVKSVLNQTFSDFELLVVDDGSTDRSGEILSSFTDSRIRIIKNEKRLKLSGALNRGIDNAQGTYVARMDADDICMPERFLKQVQFMESHPDIGMCGGWVKTFGGHESSDTVFKYPIKPEEIKASLLFDNPFAHPTVMFRKALFDEHDLLFDGSYYPGEDYELWVRVIEQFPSANIGEVLLLYRLHSSSMTLSGKPDMDAQAVRILKPLFLDMGLSLSDEEIMFHRHISTHRVASGWSKESVDRAEQWLLRLAESNRSRCVYDQAAFDRALSLVWFSVCYRSLHFGWWVVRRYASSKLCSGENRKSFVIMAAAVKSFLFRSRPASL